MATLLDGDPKNNFLKRALAFNPDGALTGARRIAFVGTFAYVLCDRGLVVVDLDNPLAPKITAQIGLRRWMMLAESRFNSATLSSWTATA